MSWIRIYKNKAIIPWYPCAGCLLIISLFVFYHVLISFVKEYRGPTLSPPCDVINDAITMKLLFGDNLERSFQIWRLFEAVYNILKLKKWLPFWCREKLFTGSNRGKLNISASQPWAFPIFWAFDRRSSRAIDRDIAILKLDLLRDLLTSTVTSWLRETQLAQSVIANYMPAKYCFCGTSPS